MDLFTRLERIPLEISQVEREKNQCQERLGLFWEHMPALDEGVVAEIMHQLEDRIRSLENRKRSLLEEQQALLVRAVTLAARGD
uniref:Uncharacterized protein n=1 Tax=Manihot esculenta TaxID=3983 RepID=A0A199U9E3_MANES